MLGSVSPGWTNSESLDVYTDGLANQPDDWELLTLRGISRFDSARRQALQDLRRAAGAGAPSFWPYYLLAQDDFEAERYHECRQWVSPGFGATGNSRCSCADTRVAWDLPADSQESPVLSLKSFDRALILDAGSERIRRNRALRRGKLAIL